MKPRPAHADDLEETLAEALRLLARGVSDRRHPFHTPTLATLGADGAPRARTMVLRAVEAAARTLRLHTDRRAGKWEELRREPRCALHLYDAGAGVQLRLSGSASLHGGDDVAAEEAWRASRDFSRLCYAVQPAPGQAVDAPPPAPSDAASGRAAFGVILFRFSRLEWLWLAAEGHRRARFAWEGEARVEASWLVP